MKPRTSRLILLALICFGIYSVSAAQQNFKIAKIEFEGLNRLSVDEMLTAAGLRVGDAFDLAALDAAAQRLVDTGLFTNVAYRTRSDHDQLTITFQVEEAKLSSSRVVFDNFIWFTDTELIGAVKRDVPSFAGTAPDNGDMVERITKALERFLLEHHIEATVNYMASQDSPGSFVQEHIFSLSGIPMPICTVHFPGSKNVPETKLIESAKPLFGNDYSNKFVSLFAAKNLIPLYREVGQLKATFSPPLAKPEASATCKSGVDLTIPVDEGEIYKWDKAAWSGNSALAENELNKILAMQPGEIANGLRLEKSTKSIQQAYGAKGYLMARVLSEPQFDDNARRVTYKFTVNEGPQFHMGKFITRGFPESVAKAMKEHWALKAGEIYNQDYVNEFSKKQMGELIKATLMERRIQGDSAPNIKWGTNLNKDSLTVDVTVQLTN